MRNIGTFKIISSFVIFFIIIYCLYTLHYLSNRQAKYIPFDGSLNIQSTHVLFHVPNTEKIQMIYLGDARWTAATRIAALDKAESLNPHLIINLADPVSKGTLTQFSQYFKELTAYWRKTPFFHIPGGHSRNPDQLYLGLSAYREYFGHTDYIVKIPEFKLKLIMLDNSAMFFYPHQLLWLDRELTLADTEGYKVLLNMHIPPFDPRDKKEAMLFSNVWLGKIISSHNSVQAIFSAHTHENIETTWQGIPLEIVGVSGSSSNDIDKVKIWSLEITKNQIFKEDHIDVFERKPLL